MYKLSERTGIDVCRNATHNMSYAVFIRAAMGKSKERWINVSEKGWDVLHDIVNRYIPCCG